MPEPTLEQALQQLPGNDPTAEMETKDYIFAAYDLMGVYIELHYTDGRESGVSFDLDSAYWSFYFVQQWTLNTVSESIFGTGRDDGRLTPNKGHDNPPRYRYTDEEKAQHAISWANFID